MNRRGPPWIELLQGTLDVLILRTLLTRPTHGHAIAKPIQRKSEDLRLDEVVECTPLGYALRFPGIQGKTVTLLRERGGAE